MNKEKQLELKNINRQKLIQQENINTKIKFYKEVKWNIPFRELYHTVVFVCKFVKPIYPNIDPPEIY